MKKGGKKVLIIHQNYSLNIVTSVNKHKPLKVKILEDNMKEGLKVDMDFVNIRFVKLDMTQIQNYF